MARFKWLGEPDRPSLTYGDTHKFDLASSTGPYTLLPVSPATTFPIGQDLGYDFTDPITIAVLNTDPRFEQI